MGGNKDMNPVLKMRKKQKEKEREKRREMKRTKKYEDDKDDIDNSYNPNAIADLKNVGKSLDKSDQEHYQQRPLTWKDLEQNLFTGTINRAANDSYGYYSGTQQSDPSQAGYPQGKHGYGNHPGGYNQPGYRGNYHNRPPQPRWQGDTLTSQPMLYNEEPAQPLAPPLSAEVSDTHKYARDKKRNNMPDEHDPLNPHKAKSNFKVEAYKTEEEKAAEKAAENKPIVQDEDSEEKDLEQFKEKPKEDEDVRPSFVPLALRKRKKKGKPAPAPTPKPEQPKVVEKEEVHYPEVQLPPTIPSSKPVAPPGMKMTQPPKIEQPAVQNADSDSSDAGGVDNNAMASLLGMYE